MWGWIALGVALAFAVSACVLGAIGVHALNKILDDWEL